MTRQIRFGEVIVFVLLLTVTPVQDAIAAEKGLPDRAKQLLLGHEFFSRGVIAQEEVQLWHVLEQREVVGEWVGPVKSDWFHIRWNVLNDFLFANGYLQFAGTGDQAPCGYGGICGPTRTWWLRPLKPTDKLKPFILRIEDTAPYRIIRETGYMPTIPGTPKGLVVLALLQRQLKDIEKVEKRQSGDVDSWKVLFTYDIGGFPEAPKRTFKAVAVANFNRFTERWDVAVQPLDAEDSASEAFGEWLKKNGDKWAGGKLCIARSDSGAWGIAWGSDVGRQCSEAMRSCGPGCYIVAEYEYSLLKENRIHVWCRQGEADFEGVGELPLRKAFEFAQARRVGCGFKKIFRAP